MKKYISLAKAAERSPYTAEEWSLLCEAQLVDANWHDMTWFIDEAALNDDFGAELARLAQLKASQASPKHKIKDTGVPLLATRALAMLLGVLAIIGTLSYGANRLEQVAAVGSVETVPTATSSATTSPETTTSSGSFSFASWGEAFDSWLFTLGDTLVYLKERVIMNWYNFLGLNQEDSFSGPINLPTTVSQTGASTTDFQKIQKIVDDRVSAQLQGILKNSNVSRSGGIPSGVVVLPGSGNPATDQEIRNQLYSTFSDPVNFKFDSSGLSGTISPVFQNVPYDNYLFLITPLKK